MKIPFGKLDEVRSLNGVKNVWVAEQYSLPEDLSADDYTISMSSSTGHGRLDRGQCHGL